MKLKQSIFLLILLLIAGCNAVEEGTRETIERSKPYCTPDSIEKRSEFVLKCLKNTNPRSDEEPEDWMGLCLEIAEKTFCPSTTMLLVMEKIYKGWVIISETPKDLRLEEK